MSERMPEPSPRTETAPMAFTADEFLRGTMAAWLAFNVLFGVTMTVFAMVTASPLWGPSSSSVFVLLAYAIPISLVVSGFVTLLLCGAAWALGRLLRRRGSFALHATCYAVLGGAIGVLVVTIYLLAVGAPFDMGNWLAQIVVGCSAAAVPLGWGWTVRRSSRIEAGRLPSRQRPADPDAAFEDSL